MNCNNLSEELNFIEDCVDKKLLSDNEWQLIKQYSLNSSSDVKYAICELLANFPCRQSEDILLTMLNDDDYIIRASACDSLKFSLSVEVIDCLVALLHDKNKIVRGFAALSIGDIQKKCNISTVETINLLEFFFKKEHSVWSKTAIARSLFLLGEYSYESVLLSSINNRFYTIRSFALNLIIELIENNEYLTNKVFLYSALQERLKKEKILCVKNCIEKTIHLLYQQKDC